MLTRRFTFLLLISAVPLLAQIVNNTVTVTASQNATAQPDEAVFSVVVTSGIDKSLDDVVAVVSSLGITAANLVQISNAFTLSTIVSGPTQAPPVPPAPPLEWVFQLVVPLAKSKDTTAALAALQKSISQNNSGLTLSFTLSGTRVSAQQAPNCNLADLINQARGQAQDIAGTAGFKAGAVVGLTSATSNGAPLGCSLTARFALGAMFGQPEPIITITATRTNAIQPDQVLIGLTVQSPTTAGLDDITGALTGAGVSGANFTSAYTTVSYTSSGKLPPVQQNVLVWSFTLTAPVAKLSATLSQILSAQQAISANNSGLILTFYVQGMQISPQLQQLETCPQAALLADAQAQAKAVAAAAGVSAGAILSMSEGIAGVAALQLGSIQAIAGDFVAGVGTSGVGYASLVAPAVYPAIQPTCSLTVQFQLM
jgi:uncharacterized protein YggE